MKNIKYKFGNGQTIKKISKEDLQNIYGGPQEPSKGDSWDVVIIASSDYTFAGIDSLGNKRYVYEVRLKKVFAGSDYEKGKEVNYNNNQFDFNNPTTLVDLIVEDADKLEEFADNLAEHPLETLYTLLLDIIIGISDIIQIGINTMQTVNLNTCTDWALLYDYDFLYDDGANLHTDEGAGNRDIYTRIDSDKEYKYVIDVDDTVFTYDTLIPVIPADGYYMASNEISFLDINFFTGDVEHSGDKAWTYIRNLVTDAIHVTFYISIALLISFLIINGLLITTSSINNPEETARHKQALQRFAFSIVMLIGSIVIMNLCILGNKMILEEIDIGNNYEGPIRVNVETAGYSFSTTATGYLRYMAQIDDVERCIEKGKYAIPYCLFVLINLVLAGIMIYRMVMMMGLSVIGPVIAVLNALEINQNMSYQNWVVLYLRYTLIQLIISITYKVLLMCAIV